MLVKWGMGRSLLLGLPLAFLVMGTGAGAIADGSGATAFLYIPGITGESPDPAHRNWIEVLSCDWGSVPPALGDMVPGNGNGPAGKLCFGDFSVLKYVDRSSKALATCCSKGAQFSQVRVEVAGSFANNYRQLILRKVKVLSVRPGETLEDGRRTEIVTLGFSQVEYR